MKISKLWPAIFSGCLVLTALCAAAAHVPYAPDVLIVTYAPTVTAADAAATRARYHAAVTHRFTLINAEVWKVPGLTDAATLTGEVSALNGVVSAELSWQVGGGSGDTPPHADDILIVKYAPAVAADDAAAARLKYAAKLTHKFRLINAEVWKLPDGSDEVALTGEVAALAGVEYAELSWQIGGASTNYVDGPEALDYANDAILVGFNQGVTALDTVSLRAQFNATLRHRFTLVNAEVWSVPPTADLPGLLRQVAALSAVRYAEQSWVVTINRTPNDAQFSSLYGMIKISGPAAWDTAIGDDNDVIVATIDTGVNYNHEDLSGNMWHNPGETPGNGRDDDSNGWVDDYYGVRCQDNGSDKSGNPMDDHNHGSHVSGTHSGYANNGVGVAGVNWRSVIMGAKFLNSGGSGYISDGAICLEYTILMGAHLSNNSWGGGGFSQTFSDLLNAARPHNYLFVAAAGNHGGNNDGGSYYPCCYPHDNVMGIAASDESDNKASFSGYGTRYVEVAAPGVNTLSCIVNGYGTMSGTSMATPHACGAARLIWSINPDLPYTEVMQILMDTCDKLSQWNGIVASGGRINVAAALERVSPPDQVPPVILNVTPADWSLTPRNLQMSITATDNLAVVSATVNGNAATNTGGDVWSYSTVLDPWTNMLTVVVRDKGKNTATQMLHYVFIPDTAPPVVTAVNPPTGFTTSSPTVPMTISATDNVAVAAVMVNGNNAVKSGGVWTYTVPLQFGTNILAVTAKDIENNAASVYVMYIRLDIEAPYISQVTPPSGYATTNYSVPMHIIATDNAGVTRLTVNGEDAVPGCCDAWQYEATLVIGSNAFVLIARDADANTATQTVFYINNHTPQHYVSMVGGHVYPYNSWSTAARDLQTALVTADDGDTINVADGTYAGQTIVVSKQVTVRRANNALGAGAAVIDGAGAQPCLAMYHAGAVVEGLTLSNGFNAGSGGGLVITAGLVHACVITRCRSNGQGGGMAIDGGVVSRCVIEGNSAFDGGGARLAGGELQECVLRNNTAQNYGGGAKFNTGGSMVSCALLGNHGNFGGGIYFYYGGAITNCTVAANTGVVGPGIRCNNGGLIHNSIIAGNSGGDYANHGGGFAFSYTCATPLMPGDGNLAADPLFIDSSHGDLHVASNSPCINAGHNAAWMSNRTDVAGLPRIIGGSGAMIVDQGACEANYLPDESIHYVCTTGRHVWPYVTWANAATNIQDAINTAKPGEFVQVAAGRYAPASEVCARSNITVCAVDGPAATSIDAQRLHRGAWISDGAVLDGFTITNGYVCCGAPRSDCGAGARVDGAALLNCILAGNEATGCGGGAYALNGALVSNCSFTGNCADEGGGVFAEQSARLIACSVAANLARVIGGGVVLDTQATLDRCDVADNVASNYGGGVYLWRAATLAAGSVHGNHAARGAGVYAAISNTIAQTAVCNNHAAFGGGMYVESTTLVRDGAVTGNVASADGGGIYAYAQALVTGVVIYGNTAGRDAGGVYGAGDSGIIGCHIVSNTAQADAGGVYLHAGALRWSTVLGNRAYNGGGIKAPGGWIENATVTRNTADNYGGGVYFPFGGAAASALVTLNSAVFGGGVYCYYGGALTNCTVSANTASSAPGVRCNGGGVVYNSIVFHNNGANYANSGSGWSYAYCCLTPAVAGTGNLTNDPQFIARHAGDYRVRDASPCVNRGGNDGWMAAAKDLDGGRRVQQGTVEIGAYELNPEAPRVVITTTNATVGYMVGVGTVAGTNNAHVTGSMSWHNSLTEEQDTFAAAPAWQVNGITLGDGVNVITVSGTNSAGDAASDRVTITRQPRPADAPLVDITNRNVIVAYETSATALGGANNQYTIGMLQWINSAGGAGAVPAASAWVIPDIPLAVGLNEITVLGTNSAGLTASDAVFITRRGPETGVPFIDITMPDATVSFSAATCVVHGTNNACVVGGMMWEVYNGPDTIAFGACPASAVWTIDDVGLAVGLNEIVVWGTNALGDEGWDVLSVTRLPAGSESIDGFSIGLAADYATPVLSWSNLTADVLVCTNTTYTTDAGAWFARATDVTSPWADVQGTASAAVYYRLTANGAVSDYDLGKLTISIRQSDGMNAVENWISSPFDFVDATGNEVAALPFDVIGVAAAMHEESGFVTRRDAVQCQLTMGGAVASVTRGAGAWFFSGSATLTNWYRERMYKLIISRVHTGPARQLTLFGKVSQRDPALVGCILQSDGLVNVQNWCAAWFPWVVPFAAADLTDVVTDYGGVPARRDAVYTQDGVGGPLVYTTRGAGAWVTGSSAATNLCPGCGYLIRISKSHVGPARDWYQPRGTPLRTAVTNGFTTTAIVP